MIAEYKNRIHVLVVAGVLVQLAALPAYLVGLSWPGGDRLAAAIVGWAGTVLLVAGFCYYAKARGHHPAWGLLGLVLGLVAIIILARLPDRTEEQDTVPPASPPVA